MRITADLLAQAEIRTNPNQDREMVLRELGIRAIENMGAVPTMDFVSLDLTNNRISALENFARFPQITHLYCAGNAIERIDPNNLRTNLPNVVSLTLSYNRVTSLAQVGNLATACPKLEFLALSGNEVTRRQHYRLFTIHRFPNLRVLDYAKIKPAERDRAERLSRSAAGAMLESDVREEAAKTFVPGEELEERTANYQMTAEEKEQVRLLLANARSAKELEEIENAVKRGTVSSLLKRKRDNSDTPDNGVSEDHHVSSTKRVKTSGEG